MTSLTGAELVSELPDVLRLVTFLFRLTAFIVASPFVLCIVLDVIAYVIGRTLHLTITRLRVPRSPTTPSTELMAVRAPTPDDSDSEDSPVAAALATASTPIISRTDLSVTAAFTGLPSPAPSTASGELPADSETIPAETALHLLDPSGQSGLALHLGGSAAGDRRKAHTDCDECLRARADSHRHASSGDGAYPSPNSSPERRKPTSGRAGGPAVKAV